MSEPIHPKSQEDIITLLQIAGVRIAYFPSDGTYRFNSNDLYEILKFVQQCCGQPSEEQNAELTALRATIAEKEQETERLRGSNAWKFVVGMTNESASAEAMNIYELGKAIRSEITDKIPMNSREFNLIDELVNRMDGKCEGYFVPVEDFNKVTNELKTKTIALAAELDDCKPYHGAQDMKLALIADLSTARAESLSSALRAEAMRKVINGFLTDGKWLGSSHPHLCDYAAFSKDQWDAAKEALSAPPAATLARRCELLERSLQKAMDEMEITASALRHVGMTDCASHLETKLDEIKREIGEK